MEKVDFNIEFAHIYSDERFGQEHKASLAVLELVLKVIQGAGQSYSLNLLIDEYHPNNKDLDVKSFINKLAESGFKPDYLYLESELHKDISVFISSLTKDKYINDYEKYFKKNGKSPCSYLVANWYLKRLGALPIENLQKLTNLGNYFCGKKIINILDRKYQENENRAIDLIKNSSYGECIDDIIYYFY